MPRRKQTKPTPIRSITNLGLWFDAIGELAQLFKRLIHRTPPQKPSLGQQGERLAEEYLTKKGWRLIARQFNAIPGEIDLIMEDGDTLVFIEVKARTTDRYGSPYEAVDDAKQHHIVQTALYYLKQQAQLERRSRFDIVSITWPNGRDNPPTIDHFPNAFQPTAQGQFYS
jgi:putative endonuclease